jgi:hypothetical protein
VVLEQPSWTEGHLGLTGLWSPFKKGGENKNLEYVSYVSLDMLAAITLGQQGEHEVRTWARGKVFVEAFLLGNLEEEWSASGAFWKKNKKGWEIGLGLKNYRVPTKHVTELKRWVAEPMITTKFKVGDQVWSVEPWLKRMTFEQPWLGRVVKTTGKTVSVRPVGYHSELALDEDEVFRTYGEAAEVYLKRAEKLVEELKDDVERVRWKRGFQHVEKDDRGVNKTLDELAECKRG